MQLRISAVMAGTLAIVGSHAAAQQPSPPAEAAAAPASDDVKESWFKVVSQARHVGFAHIELRRSMEQGVAITRFDQEFDFRDPDRNFPASGRIEASFRNDDLSLQTYRFSYECNQPPLGRSEIQVSCERQGTNQWIAFVEGTSKRVPIPITSDDPILIEEAIPILLARKPDLLRTGGTIRRKVFNPYHVAQQPCVDITVKIGAKENRPYGGRDVQVIPCRWERPFQGIDALAPFTYFVTDAGEVQEIQQAFPGNKITIPVVFFRVPSEQEAMPQVQRLVKQRGRRDPFDREKVLRPIVEKIPVKPGPGVKTTSIPDKAVPDVPHAEIEKKIEEARRTVEAAEKISKEGDPSLKTVRKLYGDFLDITLPLLRLEHLTPEQRGKVEGLRARIDRVYPGAQAIVDQGKKLLEQSREAVAQNMLADAKTILVEIRTLEGSRELMGTPLLDTYRKEVLEPGKQIENRMNARQDFQKTKMEVTGIIYHLVDTPFPVNLGARLLGQDLRVTGSVPLHVSRSGAIVNGIPLIEGDILDDKGIPAPGLDPSKGLVVAKILMDQVFFRFRGEEIAVPIKEIVIPSRGTAPAPR